MSDNVVVAVRVRPFNTREKDRNAGLCIAMEGKTTTITDPETEKPKTFAFDYSYWSHDHEQEYATQQMVFDDIGVNLLNAGFEGFNATTFAYGQTGSGKSYSMMGYGEDKGIIPLACDEIFKRIDGNDDPNVTFEVEVSYLEIYNEQVKDLFTPKKTQAAKLKIRESKASGIYVQGLRKLAVHSFEDIERLIEQGDKARTIAATNMNATSSRSHSVFTTYVKQTKVDTERKTANDVVSKINLVDLAGSERAESTGATGARLKEGCAINKSLSALGNVISALAEAGKKKRVVPYRDSVLTRLLQESLGGNSKTSMIAALSPADINYEETMGTLRYADRAKKIQNSAVVNENPNERLIRELREEIERLRLGSGPGGEGGDPAAMEKMRAQLEQSQSMIKELEMSFEEKLKRTKDVTDENAAALTDMGVSINIGQDKVMPHLVNLNEDPLMSGNLVYFLKEGETRFGREDADTKQNIVLRGLNIAKEVCIVNNQDGQCTVSPLPEALVFHNGNPLAEAVQLVHGDRIVLGNNHIYRYNDPVELEKKRKQAEEGKIEEGLGNIIDWEFARKELAAEQVNRMKASSTDAADDEKVLEMNKQLKEMEEKLKLQKEEAEKQLLKQKEDFANSGIQETEELKKKREALEKMNEELEKELKRKQEEMFKQAEKAKKDWSLLEDELGKTIPMINEANAISNEMAKGFVFKIQLRTSFGAGGKDKKTEVMVAVDDTQKGVNYLWDSSKFIDRVYVMREMYGEHVEYGKVDDRKPEDDPYFDVVQAQLIGRAQVYLEALSEMFESELMTPIIGSDSNTHGDLDIKIYPCQVDGNTDMEDQDEDAWLQPGTRADFLIKILACKGLPTGLSSDVFCKYKFFMDEEFSQTETCERRTINPTFAYEKQVTYNPVTEEFAKYLKEDALMVEVYGRPPTGSEATPKQEMRKLAAAKKPAPVVESNKSAVAPTPAVPPSAVPAAKVVAPVPAPAPLPAASGNNGAQAQAVPATEPASKPEPEIRYVYVEKKSKVCTIL